MTNVASFVSSLFVKGVKLELEEDKLKLSAPPGALSEDDRVYIQSNKKQIIAFIQKHTQQQNTLPPIGPAGDSTCGYPLSTQQLSLWLVYQAQKSSFAYNIPKVYELNGKLDHESLVRALNRLYSRHENLRSTFKEVDGRARQFIRPEHELPIKIECVDKVQAESICTHEREYCFDLENDLLFRVRILQLSDQRHYLILNFHHIITDATSIAILLSELRLLYEHQASPEPTLHYKDYSVWQQEILHSSQLFTESQAYWRSLLQGSPTLLDIPHDRPRHLHRGFAGKTEQFALTDKLSDALQQLARRENITLYMLILAAFQLLLSRFSNQEVVVVGSPTENRQIPGLENMQGFFINSLPMHAELVQQWTFTQLVHSSRNKVLDAFEHNYTTF